MNQIPFSERQPAFLLGVHLLGCNQKWVSTSAGDQVRASLKYAWCGISPLVSTALLCRSAAPVVPRLLLEMPLVMFG